MKKLTQLVIASFFGLCSFNLNATSSEEYSNWIIAMKEASRGPFSRLRWFCNDGAVLPPQSYACANHGGGVQHGEYTIKTKELRNNGYYIANILSKEDYSNKIQNLRNRANEYRKSRQEKINSLTKKRIDASSELLSSINPILSEYSKNNGISIILPKKNVVIAKTNLDITDQIIELTNSKIDQISLK